MKKSVKHHERKMKENDGIDNDDNDDDAENDDDDAGDDDNISNIRYHAV